nr:Mitochondrial fission protein [Polyrhizophydium stewartii]
MSSHAAAGPARPLDMDDDVAPPADPESSITFYQGFRASHPRLAKPRPKPQPGSAGQPAAHSQQLQHRSAFEKQSPSAVLLSLGQMLLASTLGLPIRRVPSKPALMAPPSSAARAKQQQASSFAAGFFPSFTGAGSSAGSSASSSPTQTAPASASASGASTPLRRGSSSVSVSRLPDKTRHQASAINNITRIFSELLTERDILLEEADELQDKRGCIESELAEIETQLANLLARKEQLHETLHTVIEREEVISELVDSLDARISTIGEQTVKVEKTIRTIRGDSGLLIEKTDPLGQANTCIKTLFGHKETVECVDFETPRGLLASGSADKTVRIWDLASNRCLGVLTGHSGWVRAVQIRGTTIMSGSSDHTIRQWDAAAIEQIDEPDFDAAPVRKRPPLLKASGPSRQSMYTDDDDATVDDGEGDEPSGPYIRTFEGHTGAVTSLMFDASSLLSGSADGTIRMWDRATGATLSIFESAPALDVLEGFSSIYNVQPARSDAGSDAFSGWQSASASVYGAVGAAAPPPPPSATSPVPFATVFGQPEFDGWMQLDSNGGGNEPRKITADFDFYTPVETDGFGGAAASPYAGEHAANGSRASLGSHTHSSAAASHATPATSAAIGAAAATVPAQQVASLFFEHHLLVSGHSDGIVRLWDLRTNRCHRELKGHVGAVRAVRLHDGQVYSGGGTDKTVKIWDVRLGGSLTQEIRVEGSVTGLAFDASRLAIACGIKDVVVYHASSRTLTRLEGHTRPVAAVGLVGSALVSGGMDATVRVWRVDL